MPINYFLVIGVCMFATYYTLNQKLTGLEAHVNTRLSGLEQKITILDSSVQSILKKLSNS